MHVKYFTDLISNCLCIVLKGESILSALMKNGFILKTVKSMKEGFTADEQNSI